MSSGVLSGPRRGVPGGAGAAELDGLQRQTGEPSGPHQHRRRRHHCCTTSAPSMTQPHTQTLMCAHTLNRAIINYYKVL